MPEMVLGVILVLAFPVISIVALVMASNLRTRLRQLQLRVDALETVRPSSPIASAPTEPAAAPAAAPAVIEPTPAIIESVAEPAALELPPPPPPPRVAAQPPATLEERFGTQWVVWIGGLALALGAIFLVRY